MRRRTTAILLLALVTTACGGGGSSGSGSNDTTTPPRPTHSTTSKQSTPSKGSGDQKARAAIAKAYVDFFSGRTPADRKIALVQNGMAFAAVINAQAGTPIAQGTTASVSKVTLVSTSQANVVYTVSLGGTPALKHVTGVAVNEDGSWKVGSATFCALLTLEKQAPSICRSGQ
jgi:hypothetical protein